MLYSVDLNINEKNKTLLIESPVELRNKLVELIVYLNEITNSGISELGGVVSCFYEEYVLIKKDDKKLFICPTDVKNLGNLNQDNLYGDQSYIMFSQELGQLINLVKIVVNRFGGRIPNLFWGSLEDSNTELHACFYNLLMILEEKVLSGKVDNSGCISNAFIANCLSELDKRMDTQIRQTLYKCKMTIFNGEYENQADAFVSVTHKYIGEFSDELIKLVLYSYIFHNEYDFGYTDNASNFLNSLTCNENSILDRSGESSIRLGEVSILSEKQKSSILNCLPLIPSTDYAELDILHDLFSFTEAHTSISNGTLLFKKANKSDSFDLRAKNQVFYDVMLKMKELQNSGVASLEQENIENIIATYKK